MDQLKSEYPSYLAELEKVILFRGCQHNFDSILFWDSPEVVHRFQSRGYTLYKRIYVNEAPTVYTIPSLPFIEDAAVDGQYPYAFYDSRCLNPREIALRAQNYSSKVAYAQDSQFRHLAIKIVLDDSEEYRILRFLYEQDIHVLQEHCIVPVLDFIPFDKFWFVVMPRWGNEVTEPRTHTMRELLDIMHSMLKALSFLHSHNIIHRDISMVNVLINHFADSTSKFAYLGGDGVVLYFPSPRAELRKQGRLAYALMDFDLSIMAPRNIKREEYRRPYHESYIGSFARPYDTAQGEFDYNPFAFDVGCMGASFCDIYGRYSKHIPMLAPLLDRMTTRDIARRFTAAEALRFFEEMRAELTEDQLRVKEYPSPNFNYAPFDEHDRWRDLPEAFQKKWAAYREPPLPFTTKVMRAINSYEHMPYYVIPSIRWFLFKLVSFPQFVCARLLTFFGIHMPYYSLLVQSIF